MKMEKKEKDFYEALEREVEGKLRNIECQLCYPLHPQKRDALKAVIKKWRSDLTCDLRVAGNQISFPMFFKDRKEASKFFLDHGWEKEDQDFGFEIHISLVVSRPIKPEATDEEMRHAVYGFIKWYRSVTPPGSVIPPEKVNEILVKIMAGFGIHISEDKFHELFPGGLSQAIDEAIDEAIEKA